MKEEVFVGRLCAVDGALLSHDDKAREVKLLVREYLAKEEERMGKLTEDQEKQLYKLLSQTPHDAAKWDALAKSGADDKAMRITLHDMLGAQGRHSSAGGGIICIKNRPALALWFGNHGVGVPTVKEKDLLAEIRNVFSILTPEGRTEVVKALESPSALAEHIFPKPNGLAQVPLFDYEQLDSETAGEVRDHAVSVKRLLGTMKGDAIEVGERLRAVKEHLGRGQFDGWLAAEFGMSRDSAERFIDSAELVGKNPELRANLDRFDRSAVYVLAAPSTPEPAVREATARASAGEKITPTVAREIKKRHASPVAKVGRQSDAGIKPAKKPEPEIETEADEVEAAWNMATILVQVKMMPHDGHRAGRPVQILVRNDNDKPIQQFTIDDFGEETTLRSDDLPPFKGPVGALLKRLLSEMPERIARANARLKAEKAKTAKLKKSLRQIDKAAAKPLTSFPKPKSKKRGGR